MSCQEKPCSAEAEGADVIENMKEFYGKKVQATDDFKTTVCTKRRKSSSKLVREAMALVNEEVTQKYYGCGLVAPELLEGAKILDLGSGAGMDCFILSKLVGPEGHVTGLDMTEEQLQVARRNSAPHMEIFGYTNPNVDFVKGYIEKLDDAGLEDNTFDIVISNCVVNLSFDKRAVISEAYRVLKEGGEFYFSDMYVDRELPEEVRKNKDLWGEGLSGALYWVSLVELAKEVGFSTPHLVTAGNINVLDKDVKAIVGDATYASATYRLFKLPPNRAKHTCAIYQGGIPEFEEEFEFDHDHKYKVGQYACVNEEMATILSESRFKKVFTFETSSECIVPAMPTKADVNPFAFLEAERAKGSQENTNGCA